MSIIDTTRFETRGESAVSGLIGRIKERIARHRLYRRTLDELESLSDRELADLGLHHSMLRGIAYRAAYED